MQDLIDILVSKGWLESERGTLLREQSRAKDLSIDKVLANQSDIPVERVAEARALLYGLPYINLQDAIVPPQVLNVIPSRIAKTYEFVAFEADTKQIKLGITHPLDLRAEEALQLIANRNGLEFIFYVISRDSFQHVLEQYSDVQAEVKEALARADVERGLTDQQKKRTETEEEIQNIVRDAPISKVVATIIRSAVLKEASDIHIEPAGKDVRVRFRIDGALQEILRLPLRVLPSVVSRVKVLTSLKIDETRLPQDGRMSTTVDSRAIDFRVSVMPVADSEIPTAEKVVLRVLDKSKGLLTLEKLGLTGKRLRDIREALKQPYGMFLMTGPTGSGKTTTLYSALTEVNKEKINVVTLEDPVEYYIAGVNQSQINPDIGFTFATGLRSILRQDPDAIMVGEIRDRETAEMAIHSSLTGHIVLSTLHTNTAAGAVPRLIDMGIEPFLISSATNTVAAQRLVRRLCDFCKQEEKVGSETMKMLEAEIAKIPKEELKDFSKGYKLYKGKGCKKCIDGYKGRIAIYEVILLTEEIKKIIPSKPSSEEIENIARSQGSISILHDGILKVLAGVTSLEEVMRITQSNNNL